MAEELVITIIVSVACAVIIVYTKYRHTILYIVPGAFLVSYAVLTVMQRIADHLLWSTFPWWLNGSIAFLGTMIVYHLTPETPDEITPDTIQRAFSMERWRVKRGFRNQVRMETKRRAYTFDVRSYFEEV